MSRSTIDISYIQVSGTNLGGGTQIFKVIDNNTLKFKTLVAGSGIGFSATTDTVIITGSSSGDFVTNTKFNGYTGTTAPATYQSRTSINTLTGTTLPATYQSRTSINTLTGTTLPATYQSRTSINVYTGTTAPNQFASKSAFLIYTGTTAPFIYLNKSNFNSYTGTTQPIIDSAVTGGTSLGSGEQIFLNKTGRNLRFKSLVAGAGISLSATTNTITIRSFSTGSTAAAGLNRQVQYNTGGVLNANSNLIFDPSTGLTTNILRILSTPTLGTLNDNILSRNISTGVVERITTSSIINLLTSNNGITRSGNNFRLGGTLTGTTTITSPATGSRLTFAAFPVQYLTDVSANYNNRSLVDRGFVTGLTVSTANNGLTRTGSNVRLGGALTGNTTISGVGFNLTFSNNAWTFGGRGVGTVGNQSITSGNLNIASGDTTSSIGGVGNHAGGQYASTLGGSSNKALGTFSTVIGGSSNRAIANGATAIGGLFNRANGFYSFATGTYATSSGDNSFVAGQGDSIFNLLASGNVSFNFSQNTGTQTFGHGALASNSVILGGQNHNIEVGNTGAVIVGRNGTTGIKLTGSTYIDNTVVNNLAIWNTPTVDNINDLLVWNPSTRKIGRTTRASLVGGSTPPAGSNTQIQFNNTGSFGASSNFTFNSGTGVLTTPSLTLSSAPSLGSLSDSVLIRNTSSGVIQAIPTLSIGTANNGISKVGNNYRLGGALTGNTTIGGLFNLVLDNNSWSLGTRIGSVGLNSLVVGNNNTSSGFASTAIGVNCIASNTGSIAVGSSATASGGVSSAFGISILSSGQASFAGGEGQSSRPVLSSGGWSFNYSYNDGLQTIGHGALANRSAILGGQNHNIEAGNIGAAIIGGSGIKLTGSTYINTTAVQRLAIFDSPVVNNINDLLVWNPSTRIIERTTRASLVGGSTPPAGSNTQIQFNNTGSFGASSNLTFSTGTNTLSTSNLLVSNNLILSTLPTLANSDHSILSRNPTTGIITQSNFSYTNIVYVSKNGDNTTGQLNNPRRPYLTIDFASSIIALSSTPTDRGLVFVFSGTYFEQVIIRNYVDIQLNNAIIRNSSPSGVGAYALRLTTGINEAKIFGCGEIISNNDSAIGIFANGTVTINVDKILGRGSGFGGGVISVNTILPNLHINTNEINVIGGNINEIAVSTLTNGKVIINSNRILGSVLIANSTSSGSDTHIDSKIIEGSLILGVGGGNLYFKTNHLKSIISPIRPAIEVTPSTLGVYRYILDIGYVESSFTDGAIRIVGDATSASRLTFKNLIARSTNSANSVITIQSDININFIGETTLIGGLSTTIRGLILPRTIKSTGIIYGHNPNTLTTVQIGSYVNNADVFNML